MAENIKKRKRTKKRLQDALMALYNEYEFQKITVSMLCKEAGMHRSTFYLYYSSTDELLREIENNILKDIQYYVGHVNDYDLSKTKEGLSPQEIYDLMAPEMVRFYTWQYSVRSYINPLLGAYGDPYFIQHYEDIIRDNMMPVVKMFHLKYEKQPYIMEYLVGGVIKTNKDWLSKGDVSIEELVNIQRKMLFNNPFA